MLRMMTLWILCMAWAAFALAIRFRGTSLCIHRPLHPLASSLKPIQNSRLHRRDVDDDAVAPYRVHKEISPWRGRRFPTRIVTAFLPSRSTWNPQYYIAKIGVKCPNPRFQRDPTQVSIGCIDHEASILSRVQHKNVIRLHQYIDNRKQSNKAAIVMEYAKEGDVLEWANKIGSLTEEEARGVFRQMVEAVRHLHSHHVLHRDIKLENEKGDLRIKLIDFGHACDRHDESMSENICGTFGYVPPEVYSPIPIIDMAPGDVFALGCVLVYLLDASAMPTPSLEFRPFIPQLEFWNSSSELRELVAGMLERNPKKRWDIYQVFAHPWLRVPKERRVSISETSSLMPPNAVLSSSPTAVLSAGSSHPRGSYESPSACASTTGTSSSIFSILNPFSWCRSLRDKSE